MRLYKSCGAGRTNNAYAEGFISVMPKGSCGFNIATRFTIINNNRDLLLDLSLDRDYKISR